MVYPLHPDILKEQQSMKENKKNHQLEASKKLIPKRTIVSIIKYTNISFIWSKQTTILSQVYMSAIIIHSYSIVSGTGQLFPPTSFRFVFSFLFFFGWEYISTKPLIKGQTPRTSLIQWSKIKQINGIVSYYYRKDIIKLSEIYILK